MKSDDFLGNGTLIEVITHCSNPFCARAAASRTVFSALANSAKLSASSGNCIRSCKWMDATTRRANTPGGRWHDDGKAKAFYCGKIEVAHHDGVRRKALAGQVNGRGSQLAKRHAAQSVRSAAMTSGEAGMSWFQMLKSGHFRNQLP